ncbi:MAG: ABC transporter ATP-binding protein [Oligoflexales bacterium]|nr:ABC transporter ATP-binding protein [Oligoflexales bacterium]
MNDINFSIFPGQIVSIFGHNGAGKSTCLKLILGMLKEDCGEILFKNKPLQREDRAKIGYMPELDKISTELTPEEAFFYQRGLYSEKKIPSFFSKEERKKDKQAISYMLRQVGLYEAKNLRISSLSKGMRRRVAWGLATLHKPELLLLDEPFSGLDPMGQEDMKGWIKAWKEGGGAVLMNTHELALTQELSTEIITFKKGLIVYKERVENFNESKFLASF